jgi:hypothetical protein
MISMLPESFAVHSPTNEPEYRDWKLDKQPIKTVEYMNVLAEVVTRLISDADADAGRWGEFLEKSSQLPPSDRIRVYDSLQALIAANDNVQLRTSLWKRLQSITSQHLEFADADWALPAEEVERLQGLMAIRGPGSAYVKHLSLFTDHVPNIVGIRRHHNHEEFEVELATRRCDAVKDVDDEGGLDAVKSLARESVVPWAVGIALAESKGASYVADLLPALIGEPPAELELAHAYFARLFNLLGWEWLEALLGREGLTATQRARLLWASRDFPKAWERADEEGADVAKTFWTIFANIGDGADFPYVTYCADRLISLGRYAAALDLITIYPARQGRGAGSPIH